jgi:hypothetical protein
MRTVKPHAVRFWPGDKNRTLLTDHYIEPPFTLLDAQSKRWQARKANWARLLPGLGCRPAELLFSAQGRLNALMGGAGFSSGTSLFCPVLAELTYRWWCPPGGTVLDPFAGGSVRGLVASALGLRYVGVDLDARQVEANRVQLPAWKRQPAPEWIIGGREVETLAAGVEADFILSCPPYGDLERYSDDPRDLSTMPYDEFLAAYSAIIAASLRLLKPNRFACFVVGDLRDDEGNLRGLPADTVAAFRAAGAKLFEEAVYLTPIGSLPIRASAQFAAGRKLGRCHQHVLIFVKGDSRLAEKAAMGSNAK